ncbi:hypothetical protein AUP68_16967 [Ilyonectria robusta]
MSLTVFGKGHVTWTTPFVRGVHVTYRLGIVRSVALARPQIGLSAAEDLLKVDSSWKWPVLCWGNGMLSWGLLTELRHDAEENVAAQYCPSPHLRMAKPPQVDPLGTKILDLSPIPTDDEATRGLHSGQLRQLAQNPSRMHGKTDEVNAILGGDCQRELRKRMKPRQAEKQKRNHEQSTHDGGAVEAAQSSHRSVDDQNSQWDSRSASQCSGCSVLRNSPWISPSGDGPVIERGLVQWFMDDPGVMLQRDDQADAVLSFCTDETLHRSKHGSSPLLSEKGYLLDDRLQDGSYADPRGYLGPLSVQEFYSELKSKIAARCVRETSSTGFPFMQFAFDLSFYVWKTTSPDEKPQDDRKKSDGQPLRQVFDLSFLRRNDGSSDCFNGVDYLCEAQASLSIAMIDDARWVAYGFFDTYFCRVDERECAHDYAAEDDEEEDEKEEDEDEDDEDDGDDDGEVDDKNDDKNDEEEIRLPCGIQPEPLSQGSCDANKLDQDPWKYFWIVLEARIESVRIEWQLVTRKLKERVETWIDAYPPDTISRSSASYKKSHAWIFEVRRWVCQLTYKLTALIKEWKSFDSSHPFPMDRVKRKRAAIGEAIRELERCVQTLNYLDKRCGCYAESLSLCISVEGNQHTKIQTHTAQSNQTVTNYMLYCVYPTTLAAGLLSMQEKAIPVIFGPTKLSFVILAATLTALVAMSVACLHRWGVIKRFLWEKTRVALAHGWVQWVPTFLDEGRSRANAEDLERGSNEN